MQAGAALSRHQPVGSGKKMNPTSNAKLGSPFVFYCGTTELTSSKRVALSPPYEYTVWQPTFKSFWPLGVTGRKSRWILMWLLHRLHLFGSPEYCAIIVRKAGVLVHHTFVFPKWYRIPAMADRDLEIGSIWTAPDHRKKGLALFALQEIVRRYGRPTRKFWYVSRESNYQSIALAERVGFTLVGTGTRIPRLGISRLGRLIICEVSELGFPRSIAASEKLESTRSERSGD